MDRIEEIAQAALSGDALAVRSLTQDFLRENPQLSQVRRPATDDATLLAASAAILELLAQRQHQPPPDWTAKVGGVTPPIYLVKSAYNMRRLREMCETESPTPLRKRGFYAPANYLQSA